MKELYKNDKSLINYEKYLVLESCYMYKINPKNWIEKAKGEFRNELFNLFVTLHLSISDYVELEKIYVDNRRIMPFDNLSDEIMYNQKVVFNYCINHVIRLIDISKLDYTEHFVYEKNNINNALNFLISNKHPLINKSWEKELIDFLKK